MRSTVTVWLNQQRADAANHDYGLAGSIKATGEPGGGARFTIEIPVATPEKIVEYEDEVRKGHVAGDLGEAPRVLISDSEAHVQDLLVHLLEDMGYRFDTSGSSEGTLSKIRSGNYDALIADFSMPQLDGPALLNLLKDEKPDLAERVIFLASDPTEQGVIEFATASGSTLIGKPFSLDTIRSALRRLIEGATFSDITVH